MRSGSAGNYGYAVKAAFANRPVVYVSFHDALRFVNWLQNGQGDGDTETGAYTITPLGIANNTIVRDPDADLFLPGENEWYKAAYYDAASATYFDYPAGSDAPTVCSAPTLATNRANCGDVFGSLTAIGAYPGSPSPSGSFDQGGNVSEWTEQQRDGWARSFRGGNWTLGADYLLAASRIGSDPANEFDFVGFRVASLLPEPEAGLLGLASFACLAALTRRRTGSGQTC